MKEKIEFAFLKILSFFGLTTIKAAVEAGIYQYSLGLLEGAICSDAITKAISDVKEEISSEDKNKSKDSDKKSNDESEVKQVSGTEKRKAGRPKKV